MGTNGNDGKENKNPFRFSSQRLTMKGKERQVEITKNDEPYHLPLFQTVSVTKTISLRAVRRSCPSVSTLRISVDVGVHGEKGRGIIHKSRVWAAYKL